ncbi:hypothetical protein LSG23_20535 (plasmid) [Bacillus velezensis]|uniref:hypothetical protein n=1 Tax=Bacillus velezensis TaxID=492670 RepID=UPI000987DD10|nr:hypothetical protein [Bacillus velezensis]AQS42495.1 hypothetical protein BVH55_00435 [Bacillus velezensis]WNR83203.1 hypothetical protein RP314_20795 [Bacillus velezensis]
MQRLINRYGEINIVENKGILKMPYTRLGEDANKSNLSEAYIYGIKKFGMSDLIIYSTDLRDNGNYFEMEYDLKNKRPFIDIRSFQFVHQLSVFSSIVEIGRMENLSKQQVLWEKENFLFDTDTGKVRALIFEFDKFPLYIVKNSFEGVKSLIFLALTNLERFEGKPRRSDFIDQSDKIIDFANKILISKSIDDIEKVIEQTLESEISFLREKEKEEEEKKSKLKKKLFSKKNQNNPERTDYKSQLKKTLASNSVVDSQIADNRSFSVRMADNILTPKGLIVLFGVASVLLVGAYILPHFYGSNSNAGEEERQKITTETMNAYRTYIMGDKEKAYAKLDDLGYENLDETDKKILLKFYLDQGKYTKALDNEPDYAYKIGDKLVNESKKDDLEKIAMASDSKVLNFDLASMNKEYQSVINRVNDLKHINERRANEIVKAYYLTNQETELEDFISAKEKQSEKENNNELLNQITALRTVQQDMYNNYTSYRDLDKDYNSLSKELDVAKKKKNTSEIQKLESKIITAKQKRDEAYSQIEKGYTTVNYTDVQ